MINNGNLVAQDTHTKRVVFFHHIIVWMLSCYLLADIISGFFVLQIGVDIKFSLFYKMALFVCLLMMIARYQFNVFIALLFGILLLFISPLVELFRLPQASFFVADFASIIKILMPLIVFVYLSALHKEAPIFAGKWIQISLWTNFMILLGNLGLGALGFGRSSYTLSDDKTVGSNGYIYAANELGAALIVLLGFALHMFWNHYKKYYILMALLSLLCGLLIATKTAMLSSFLLVFLIPLFNERQHFFSLTWLKIKLLVPAVLFLILVIIFIVDLLEGLGLYDKMMWVLSQKGILGIIWSGRDAYSLDLLNIYLNESSFFQQIFGQGSGGVAEHLPIKYAAEVDSVDTLVWFGFSGLLICLAMPIYFITLSAKYFVNANSLFAPCVLLINVLLLFLSQFSGHVWMSGTLGIGLGLLNALLLLENRNKKEKLDV